MNMSTSKLAFWILRCLVAPASLYFSAWTHRQQWWLIFSRTLPVTSFGDFAIFSLPSTLLQLPVQMMNLLKCFPVRVRASSSTGGSPWMPWYTRRIIVSVVVLELLFMMGMTWLFSYMRVRRWRTCSSRMVLSLTPAPRKILSSQECADHHQAPSRGWRDGWVEKNYP